MVQYAQGPCECTKDCGNCCFTMCCPCLAYMNAANDIGSSNGALYCYLTSCCCLGCCSLVALSQEVKQKRGIEGGQPKSAVYAFFNLCTCYSCSVTNEAKLYKKDLKKDQVTRTAPPTASEIQRGSFGQTVPRYGENSSAAPPSASEIQRGSFVQTVPRYGENSSAIVGETTTGVAVAVPFKSYRI